MEIFVVAATPIRGLASRLLSPAPALFRSGSAVPYWNDPLNTAWNAFALTPRSFSSGSRHGLAAERLEKVKSHIRERVVQNAAGLIPRGYGLVDRDGCALREKYDQVAAIRHRMEPAGNPS